MDAILILLLAAPLAGIAILTTQMHKYGIFTRQSYAARTISSEIFKKTRTLAIVGAVGYSASLMATLFGLLLGISLIFSSGAMFLTGHGAEIQAKSDAALATIGGLQVFAFVSLVAAIICHAVAVTLPKQTDETEHP
jgi:exopolysaccharide biosynthesis protein